MQTNSSIMSSSLKQSLLTLPKSLGLLAIGLFTNAAYLYLAYYGFQTLQTSPLKWILPAITILLLTLINTFLSSSYQNLLTNSDKPVSFSQIFQTIKKFSPIIFGIILSAITTGVYLYLNQIPFTELNLNSLQNNLTLTLFILIPLAIGLLLNLIKILNPLLITTSILPVALLTTLFIVESFNLKIILLVFALLSLHLQKNIFAQTSLQTQEPEITSDIKLETQTAPEPIQEAVEVPQTTPETPELIIETAENITEQTPNTAPIQEPETIEAVSTPITTSPTIQPTETPQVAETPEIPETPTNPTIQPTETPLTTEQIQEDLASLKFTPITPDLQEAIKTLAETPNTQVPPSNLAVPIIENSDNSEVKPNNTIQL